jgi:ADP-ribosyl-[dinitrogen reductase] hydrolase
MREATSTTFARSKPNPEVCDVDTSVHPEVRPDDPVQVHRACGAFIGSAVGDALGAPFEFGHAGDYRNRFPEPVLGGVGEMVGGGEFGWAPGQFTDDTEMAVVVAESLLTCHGLVDTDQLRRFRVWRAGASDVGNLTREVLDSPLLGSDAAVWAFEARGGRDAAGNGSLMRAAAGAVFFAPLGREQTMAAGQLLSAVTHYDPLAQWATALQHELVRLAIAGADPLAHLPELLECVPAEVRAVYAPLLDPIWSPDQPGPSNGSAMGALAQAVWAVRHYHSFEGAVTAVIDLGHDTDSVAAVTGTLAGAIHGLGAIPSRWLTYVHGYVTGLDGVRRRYDHLDLQALAHRLLGLEAHRGPDDEPPAGPVEVAPGVHAANRAGARHVDDGWAVVSLCRIDDAMRRPVRREVYLVDRDHPHNPALSQVLDDTLAAIAAFRAEGREVLVHCHGGRSRTAFVLAAWLMQSQGLSKDDAWDRLCEVWPLAVDWTPSFGELLERLDGRA